MSVTLRAATRADVEAVLHLWAEDAAEATHTDNAHCLERLLSRDPEALIVAEDPDDNRGRLVGTVVAAWDGWRGSVYRLVVARTHRRMGLGGALVAAAELRLAQAGAERLQAIVVATDPGAVRFWTATGWERQSERLRFVRG
jgi:ribosomal protein S18 acetylase RimI-like enzyme